MAKLSAPYERPARPAPGLPTFEACPHCQCTVLARLATQRPYRWHNPKTDKDETLHILYWQPMQPPLEPLTGAEHDCALALIRYAARWQYIVAMRPCRTTRPQEDA